ncbi:uncharacterized protein LOC120476208 [Pimephales promelas]|uniref:uncharacterized protein LOC120476208 n=1 Tax=Pimephales promelas TaxID=90988 RepID=UPI0019555F69|nr:uncharacterized protein LOC120476208 [Pimephales promelas]
MGTHTIFVSFVWEWSMRSQPSRGLHAAFMLRSRLSLVDESGQARDPQGAGPVLAEATWRMHSWGSQKDLSEGLELGPRAFSPSLPGGSKNLKCVDIALALRLQGISILNYIDDWLILVESEQLAVRHRGVVLAHMQMLGLRLNTKKSVLSPVQRTTFLCVVWDSVTMRATLWPVRVAAILTAIKELKLGQSRTVKQLERLLGLLAAASNEIPFGLLYMRPVQWWLRTRGFSPRGNPLRIIKITRRCLHALVIWRKHWFLTQGPVLGALYHRVTISTDASLTGWGAVMEGHSVQGLWRSHQLSCHINCL